MASISPFTILLLTWLLMALPLCFSESRLFRFQDDIRPLIPLDEFGFTSPGGLELVLSHFSFSFSFSPPIHPHPDLSQVGFFLWPRQSLTHLIRQFDNRQIECPLRTDIVKKSALTFQDFEGRSSNSFTMFRSIDVDEHYTLLFANCVEGMKISMEVESSMFDLISPGVFSPGNYLSAGEKPLPIVYLLFCSAYFALALLWTLRFLIGHKKRHVVFRVHFLILSALILKAMNSYHKAEKFSHIKRHGFLVHDFKVVFYVLRFLTETTIFTLIALLSTSTGILSFLRPFPLPDKGKKVVFYVIIPLQIIGNIAKVIVDETGPFGDDRFTWKVVFLVNDLICCFAWLVINDLSLKDLQQSSHQEVKLSERLEEYFAGVKVYVFLTRVVLFAWYGTTINMMSYRYVWSNVVASELTMIGFYVFLCFTFRPDQISKYHYSLQIDGKMEEGEAQPVTKKMVK